MSQYFDVGDETLWNPATGVSQLFRRQVEVFEAELELASGIGPMENDECQITLSVFEVFVNALLTWHQRKSHPIIVALSENFTGTALVLAQRAGITLDWPPEGDPWAARLRRTAHELSLSMPR
ncbi:DUF6086 family protein [Streptomyces sp. CA-111067]|uniref:DUF6086 family protein n=1 Tax=Streptomyces sp. CA-111067 TaxID=3240046 RepID=UPI003D960608